MRRWLFWGPRIGGKARKVSHGDTAGYIDGLGPDVIRGWAVWQGDRPPVLALRLGADVFPLFPRWWPRPDLGSTQWKHLATPGFSAYMPAALARRLAADPASLSSLQVLAGDAVLPFSARVAPVLPDARVQIPQVFATRLDGRAVNAELTALPFRLLLRFIEGAFAPADVRLVCNGEVLDCAVQRSEEPAAANLPASVTFEFELPGRIWHVDEDGHWPRICFLHEETRFPETPIELTREQAAGWLEIQAKAGPHETFEQMLALEHLHFLADRLTLDAATAAYFAEVAHTYRLDDYIPASGAMPGGLDTAARPREFWRAVRDFNARLPQWTGREDRLLKEVGAGLSEAARSEFVEHVAPFFFRIGRFDVIRPYVTLARAEELASWADAFTVSMSLPFFVASGQVERAAKVIYSFPEKKGWVSTDAVAAASALLAADPQAFPDHEKFAYAVISLIDSLAADYWSRHQDAELMRALSVWLDRPALLSSWIRRDLLAAAIRNYGMSEEFWARTGSLLDAGDPLLEPLRDARAHFHVLCGLVRQGDPRAAWPADVQAALAYFRRVGNHDLPRVLRELLCARLLSTPVTAEVAGQLPLQDLLAFDAAEVVRLAALPVADNAALTAGVPAIRQALLAMQGDIERSAYYELQCRIGQDLRRLESGMAPALQADLAARLRDVDMLVLGGNNCLAADVLARVLELARDSAPAAVAELAQALLRVTEAGLRERAPWPYQPLMAAMASLRRAAGNDRAALRIVQRLTAVTGAAYGDARGTAIEDALAAPNSLRLSAAPGRDTLVVVYSCRKYLDTRVRAMRDTWLKRLQERGIPFVVVVGDGNDELDGDLLALDVSDRYEDLPAKTLAMIRWVAAHTDYQYLLKVDDDCLLNVDEYFDSLSYRKFHYYGRAIRRPVGGTDRQWHQQKSQGLRAQHAIDKSPEPSTYADGGGGYCLSRLAMLQVLAQSHTPAGRRLMACSYMEDKLVGDLLSGAGIYLSCEDYYTLIRRRFGKDATPVAIWDNSFLPSALTPTKLVHLDTVVDMAPTLAGLHAPVLLPHKIWPGHSAPSIWYNRNQLELLTPLPQLQRLTAESLFVVAVMRNEMTMAPHFLGHYRHQGVRAFIIVDNISDDGTREYLLAQPDVVLYSADGEYKESTYGVSWQQTVLAHHCLGKWALVADADELLVYPGCERLPLAEFVAGVDAAGFDAVRVDMVDMYPFGDLAEADFRKDDPFAAAPWFDSNPLQPRWLINGYYSNAPNYVSALRHRQMPFADPDDFTSQKYCLVRYAPWMRFPAGLHNVANARIAPAPVAFAHFKYHAGFKAKVEEEVLRRQHFGGAQEYRKYLGMLAESQGRFGREGISVRYTDSAGFVAAARGG